MPSQRRICTWCLGGYTPSVTSHSRWCESCACLNDAGRANRLAGLKIKWNEQEDTLAVEIETGREA